MSYPIANNITIFVNDTKLMVEYFLIYYSVFSFKNSTMRQYRLIPDARIIPCIVSFLEAKMSLYADLHEWDSDHTDFILDDFYPSNTMKKNDVIFATAAKSKTHFESINKRKERI